MTSLLSMKIPLGRLIWVPGVEQLAGLVEDLNAIVAPVTDVDPAAGVHREGVRLVELERAAALLPPRLDVSAVGCEPQDASVVAAMPLGHENLAVGQRQHIVWLIEIVRRHRAAGLAEGQEELAVRTELVDLHSLFRARARERCGARAPLPRPPATLLAVGHQMLRTIDVDACGNSASPYQALQRFPFASNSYGSRCVESRQRSRRPLPTPDARAIPFDLHRAGEPS